MVIFILNAVSKGQILVVGWTKGLIGLILLCCAQFVLAQSSEEKSVAQNTELIDAYYEKGSDYLATDKVVALAQKVIRSRRLYHGDTIAKTYVLLADVAISKGDMEQARQFSLDGLKVISLDRKTQLELLLKVALANYSQGQFEKVKTKADEVLNLATEEDIKSRLKAHGYRAVYFALTSQYEEAVAELELINRITLRFRSYSQQIELLEILAVAYHYLEDYDTAVSIHLKVLKLRFELKQLKRLGNTYYSLASAYWKMGRLDDAYNAYWEARVEAEKVEAPIRLAYAELGLGLVLFDQGSMIDAQQRLQRAESIFNGQNLTKPYLTALINLAKVSFELSEDDYVKSLLLRAESLSKNMELTSDQIELYQLLSQMYANEAKYQLAWQYQQKYLEASEKHIASLNQYRFTKVSPHVPQQQARQIALDIADKTKLEAEYNLRYQKKNQLIFSLSVFNVLLVALLVLLLLMRRRDKHSQAYKEHESPVDILASSTKTKQMYQLAFKKARRYEYPICVAYIKVTNWNDLLFRTNRKGLDEAKRSIATVVNEYIDEFDLAGELNNSEYLLIFPHQTLDDVQVKIKALTEALRVRFFANLGDFVVYFNYAVDSPTVQDIEPYIFLSRLTDSIKEQEQLKT
ncbi:hypothetical protein LP316_02985 [Thalassotalea sp. LPB0316]|uniref:tetratricopeptide repeat protein n=1 Tax=Thalassotalea sp. LPB0316 TaxID=2769490 RepID=UPI001865DA70|nr:tetratricopeptide repeat protein [Thalassotalea sp. LPB0316]QOL26285.1 hypothetical protein LP316_02985 [Thalassotalea sp. LPB0316]